MHGQILTASAERELILLDAYPCDPVLAFEQAMVYEMPHRVATILRSARHHIRTRHQRDPPCKKNRTTVDSATMSTYCGTRGEKRKRQDDTTPNLRSALYRRPAKRRLIIEGELGPNAVLFSSFDPAAPTLLGPGLLNPEFIAVKPFEARDQTRESDDEEEGEEPEWDYNDVSPAIQAQVMPAAPVAGPVRSSAPVVPAIAPGTTAWHTYGPLHDIFGVPKPENTTQPTSAEAPDVPDSSLLSTDSVIKEAVDLQVAGAESECEGEEKEENLAKSDEDE